MGGRTTHKTSVNAVTTDPWAAFGYIVSGVAVYGVAGWALGLWLGTRLLIPVGILFGAALGMYMVVARFTVGMASVDPPRAPAPGSNAPTDRQPAGDAVTGPATSRGDDS